MMTTQSTSMDLLHPLVSCNWEEYMKIPHSVSQDLQVVSFNDNLYFVGKRDKGDVLICCKKDSESHMSIIPCPAVNSTLTTYQGKLILVGGRVASTYTNKLWSLQDDGSWIEELPPMTTERSGAAVLSTGHHLIVAGGGYLDAVEEIVEVFDGKRWLKTLSPPELLSSATSALLDGEWYVKGVQQNVIFSARVDALIANTGEDEADYVEWRELPELHVPLKHSSIVAFCGYILALQTERHISELQRIANDGFYVPNLGFYAHAGSSWQFVVDLPQRLPPYDSIRSTILPSGELVVADTSRQLVYKASIKVDSLFHKGRLSIGAIMRLQYAINVPLFQRIGAERMKFSNSLRIKVAEVDEYSSPPWSNFPERADEKRGKILVKYWIDRLSPVPATWRSLMKVLASVEELASLSKTVEDCLTDMKTRIVDRVGEEEVVKEKIVTCESSLEDQLHELREANKVLEMESQQQIKEEVQKVNAVLAERDAAVKERKTFMAERDAALEKIDKLQAQLRDNIPSLTMLINFPGSKGSINIPERIGINYLMFGITLLDDSKGDKVGSIVRQLREDSLNINIRILKEWIRGRGRRCTWDNLIYALRLHCGTLADEIEKGMKLRKQDHCVM